MTRIPAADASGGMSLLGKENQISAGMRLLAGDSMTLNVGLDYQYTRFEYDGLESRDRDLHRLQVPVRFETEIGDWQLKGYVAPGVSTSSNVMKDLFNQASGDDLIVTGRMLLERSLGDSAWFAGIAHDRLFGESRAYPVIGLAFEPRPDTRVRLAFPDPSITIKLSNRQSLDARIFPAGHQWHVVSDDFSSAFDYRVEAWRAQLTWRLPLWRRFGLDISAGYEIERRHYLTSDSGARLDIEVDDQWFMAIGFSAGAAPQLYTHGANF